MSTEEQVRAERRRLVLRRVNARRAAANARRSTLLRTAVLLRAATSYESRH